MRVCIMCEGTGQYPYRTPEVTWAPCAACAGKGIEYELSDVRIELTRPHLVQEML